MAQGELSIYAGGTGEELTPPEIRLSVSVLILEDTPLLNNATLVLEVAFVYLMKTNTEFEFLFCF